MFWLFYMGEYIAKIDYICKLRIIIKIFKKLIICVCIKIWKIQVIQWKMIYSFFKDFVICASLFTLWELVFLFLPFERYQLCMHHKFYYDLDLFCSTWFHANITILSCINLCKSCFFKHKLCSGPLQQSPIKLHICVIKGLKGTKLQCFLKLIPSTLTPYLNSTIIHVHCQVCMWPSPFSNLWIYYWVKKKTQQTDKLLMCYCKRASLLAQLVKNLPAMQETLVWFLGWDVPLDIG